MIQRVEMGARELDLQLNLLEERTRDADREIMKLENEVMNQRTNVRDWEDYIDRMLTGEN